MKLTTTAGRLPDARVYERGEGFFSPLTRAFAGLRAGAEARRLRADLAGLDAHLLRDIGIADDEIPRIHAQEDYIPRHWRD